MCFLRPQPYEGLAGIGSPTCRRLIHTAGALLLAVVVGLRSCSPGCHSTSVLGVPHGTEVVFLRASDPGNQGEASNAFDY